MAKTDITKTPYQTLDIKLLELNNGQLEGLPKNPRFIKDEQYEKLKQSIEDSPEFLEARTLLVYPLENGHYIIIAGNMRYRACKELGFTELPCYIFPKETTVQKLKEYTIKDNVAFGNMDWDSLANDDWEVDDLMSWGLECSFLSANDVDFDRVDEIKEENYEQPNVTMLECPKCHLIDFAVHFKKVSQGTTEAVDATEDELEDDLREEDTEENVF